MKLVDVPMVQNGVTGNTVSPANSWNWFGLKRLDTSRKYIMVAPQGIDNGWANTGGRDLAFTDDMIKIFKEGLCIDESRIFAGGFSYGGMWSSTLSCQRECLPRALAAKRAASWFYVAQSDATLVHSRPKARTRVARVAMVVEGFDHESRSRSRSLTALYPCDFPAG